MLGDKIFGGKIVRRQMCREETVSGGKSVGRQNNGRQKSGK